MTTPEPRVRVTAPVHVTKLAACDTYWGEPAWAAGCRECGEWIAGPRLTWGGAITDALQHDCAGVRLARLIRELEAMRDRWIETAIAERRNASTVADAFGLVGHANGIDYAADNLTALIDRATDGAA